MTVEIRYVTVLYCCAPSPGTKCISHAAGTFHQYGIGAGPFFPPNNRTVKDGRLELFYDFEP